MEGYECESCAPQIAKKTGQLFQIARLVGQRPDFLAIHLKRWDNNSRKVTKKLAFKFDLDIEDYCRPGGDAESAK